MNFIGYEDIVSPLTKEKLTYKSHSLTDNSGNKFKIIKKTPVLLPPEYMADWHRELIEILLWEYPDEIENIYKEKDWASNPTGVYTVYIKRLLHDKQGILKAFESYSNQDTAKWIIPIKSKSITNKQISSFRKFTRKSIGKKRTDSKLNGKGIFAPHDYFGTQVNNNNPKTLVEFGTGAGGGTASVALHMGETAKLYTIDIGFECLGNAIGIRKYQHKQIYPICANFWFLPFADSSVNSVFTFNGLDESRETEKTIKKVSRTLKQGGIFTVSSRKNAFMRQGAVLEQFGFTQSEVENLFRSCRIYTNDTELFKLCEQNGLTLKSCREFVINENRTQVVSQFIKK